MVFKNNVKIPSIHFHVLSKIIVLIFMVVSIFSINTLWSILLTFLYAMMYMIVQGYIYNVKKYIVMFLILSIALYANHLYNIDSIIFNKFYLFMILKMLPLFMVLNILIKTQPGEIISFLQHFGFSHRMTLVIVVVFRFTPTLFYELCTIKDNMKGRGLLKLRYVLNHPLKTFEHGLIPLLLKSLNIADELSISAMTRGIEAPGAKYSYYTKSYKLQDFLWVLSSFMFFITLFMEARYDFIQ